MAQIGDAVTYIERNIAHAATITKVEADGTVTLVYQTLTAATPQSDGTYKGVPGGGPG